MLKYNSSNPSLLKISVEFDWQINLKQFCVVCTFLQTVLVYFKAEFDSNYHMDRVKRIWYICHDGMLEDTNSLDAAHILLHNGKVDLWQWNPQYKMIKNEWKSVVVSIFGPEWYTEGMKMCSFTGYKCKSCVIVQFPGFKLFNEKYHRPNL